MEEGRCQSYVINSCEYVRPTHVHPELVEGRLALQMRPPFDKLRERLFAAELDISIRSERLHPLGRGSG